MFHMWLSQSVSDNATYSAVHRLSSGQLKIDRFENRALSHFSSPELIKIGFKIIIF